MNKALHEAELAGTHTASRPRDWRKAMSESQRLGDEFLELADSGRLIERIKPL